MRERIAVTSIPTADEKNLATELRLVVKRRERCGGVRV
jgi:hypothetical protein